MCIRSEDCEPAKNGHGWCARGCIDDDITITAKPMFLFRRSRIKKWTRDLRRRYLTAYSKSIGMEGVLDRYILCSSVNIAFR